MLVPDGWIALHTTKQRRYILHRKPVPGIPQDKTLCRRARLSSASLRTEVPDGTRMCEECLKFGDIYKIPEQKVEAVGPDSAHVSGEHQPEAPDSPDSPNTPREGDTRHDTGKQVLPAGAAYSHRDGRGHGAAESAPQGAQTPTPLQTPDDVRQVRNRRGYHHGAEYQGFLSPYISRGQHVGADRPGAQGHPHHADGHRHLHRALDYRWRHHGRHDIQRAQPPYSRCPLLPLAQKRTAMLRTSLQRSRPVWWDGALWFRIYTPGGFDGYRTITDRRLACSTLRQVTKNPALHGEVSQMSRRLREYRKMRKRQERRKNGRR